MNTKNSINSKNLRVGQYSMRDTRGFTLLEAVLIIAILGIIVTAISPLFRTVVEGRDEQDRRLELLQASRIGMDEMVRNIRTATVFTTANASRIDFENWNAVDIEYKLTGNVLKKDNNVLLENVDNLTFTYYDTEGNVTSTEEDVCSTMISMTISDPEGKADAVTVKSFVTIRKDTAASDILVAVNEINYNFPGGGSTERQNEWVEIYNYSLAAIDVAGWTIDGDTILAAAGTTVISAGGYGIITADPTQVYVNYTVDPGAIRLRVGDNRIGNGLGDNGDTITILNSVGVEADAVTYDDAWGGDGDGDTIERKDPTILSSDASNWEASSALLTYTPGATNTTTS